LADTLFGIVGLSILIFGVYSIRSHLQKKAVISDGAIVRYCITALFLSLANTQAHSRINPPGIWNFTCCGGEENLITEYHEYVRDSIIFAHLAATGGTAWDSIKTAVMKINLVFANAPDLKTDLTYTISNGQAYRMDMKSSFSETSICVNGNKGWSVAKIGDQLIKQTIDSLETKELSWQKFVGSPLHGWKEKGYVVSLVRTDTAQGKTAHVFRVEFEPATTYFCYIDSASLLEVRRTIDAPSKGNMLKFEMEFADYQPVSGVWLPRQMKMTNKKGVMIWEYQDIKLNVPVDGQLFEKPK
jgi:hypothetical protein